jgi:hypothetical protein
MKTTLLQILWKKEKIHWKRVKEMFGKFGGWVVKLTLGLLVIILVTIFHYMFAFMHTLFELFLFIFARNVFKSNLQKLALKV